jgi:hypothetical protein
MKIRQKAEGVIKIFILGGGNTPLMRFRNSIHEAWSFINETWSFIPDKRWQTWEEKLSSLYSSTISPTRIARIHG